MHDKLLDLILWNPEQRRNALEALYYLTQCKLVCLHTSEMELLANALLRLDADNALRTVVILYDQGYLDIASAVEQVMHRGWWTDLMLRRWIGQWTLLEPRVRDRLLAQLTTVPATALTA